MKVYGQSVKHSSRTSVKHRRLACTKNLKQKLVVNGGVKNIEK